MLSFKPKSNKQLVSNKLTDITLDTKHDEMLEEFKHIKEIQIPKLKKKREQHRKFLKENKNLTFDEELSHRDSIKNITKEITVLNQKKKNYHLDNSKCIFDYFENKKKISDSVDISSNTDVLNFFNIKSDTCQENNTDNIIKTNATLLEKYLSNLNEVYLNINNYMYYPDVCQYCNTGELIPIENEGILVCSNCSKYIPYLIENEKQSYKEPPKELCFYAYKRINHFKEILSQFQGKETTQIPEEVIDNIKIQIKKERISYNQLTYYKCKDILKKLGYNKHYEHINFIKYKLGIKPPVFLQEIESILHNLFMEIQHPYAKHCPNYRTNFLHYYYVLYKLLELLKETKYLDQIPMLKDRTKIIEQDNIWKKICPELNWEFIPTV